MGRDYALLVRQGKICHVCYRARIQGATKCVNCETQLMTEKQLATLNKEYERLKGE